MELSRKKKELWSICRGVIQKQLRHNSLGHDEAGDRAGAYLLARIDGGSAPTAAVLQQNVTTPGAGELKTTSHVCVKV